MKQIEVTIMGQSYILACTDGGEAALMQAVAHVDREMCAIRDAGKVKARERIAVLAALNIAYEVVDQPRVAADAGTATDDAASSTELAHLVKRIDEALGQDGQLL